MITFLSATPGSGKTLWATEQLLILSRKNIKNLKHNYFYAKAFFEKITQLELESELGSVLIEEGQGLEKTTRIEFLESYYFDFLKTEYSINVISNPDYDDLSVNYPAYYFERLSILNIIINKLNKEHATKFSHFQPVRTIYSNIANLKLVQVRPLPENCDWTTTPQGSYFAIDECQLIPMFSDEARTIDPIVRKLTIHRHKGYDFLFITQDPSFVNKYVRKLASLHIHLINIFGWEQSMMIQWSIVQDAPNGARNIARSESIKRWPFPKHVYDLYTSTTINTRVKRIPKKMVIFAVLAVLLFIAAGVMLYKKNTSPLISVMTGDTNSFLGDNANDKSKEPKPSDAKSTGSPVRPSETDPKQSTDSKQNTSEKTDPVGADTSSSTAISSDSAPEATYDVSNPFAYAPSVQPAVVNHRSFSGCVSYSGKHYAVDQQGTLIKQFSASDCKKLLDKSYNRPFDYFGNRTPPPPVENNYEQGSVESSPQYQQALIQAIAQKEAEQIYRSKNPQISVEHRQPNEPQSKYLDSAGRY